MTITESSDPTEEGQEGVIVGPTLPVAGWLFSKYRCEKKIPPLAKRRARRGVNSCLLSGRINAFAGFRLLVLMIFGYFLLYHCLHAV